MLTYLKNFTWFGHDEDGIAAIEYALIASLMTVILVALFPTLSAALKTTFTNISTHLTTGT